MSNQMQNVQLAMPIQLAQALAEYLSKQPYREVQVLIDGMQRMQPIPAAKSEGDEPETKEPKPKLSEKLESKASEVAAKH